MAIQIQNSAQYTNGSGFLPGNSRENSQASGSHYSKHYNNNDGQKINIQQVNAHSSGHGGSSSNRNSSTNNEKTTAASGSNNKTTSQQDQKGSTRIDDTILQERD
jgi:hypothetical protein